MMRVLFVAVVLAVFVVASRYEPASLSTPRNDFHNADAFAARRRADAHDATSPLSPRWTPRRGSAARPVPKAKQTTVRDIGRNDAPPQQHPVGAASSTIELVTDAPATPVVPGPTRMLQLAFMHRHGARTGPQVNTATGTLSWAQAHLSDPGAAMAVRLGQQIRAWYGSFIGDVYDRNQFQSVSTDIERTIRTGYGVISGAFNRTSPDSLNNFSIPFLGHLTAMADTRLGYYYSWAAALLHKPELEMYNLNTATETLQYFSQAELAELGTLTGATFLCDNLTLATTCVLFAEDYGTCKLSNHGISLAYAKYLTPAKLLGAQARSNLFIYGLNLSNPFVRGIGPYGMEIVTDILDQFSAALTSLANNATGVATPPVYHYSAHDITLVGLFVALGLIDQNTTDILRLVPTFTAVARFELYSNASVTLLYSTCAQTFGEPQPFSDDETVQLRCMTSNGTEYSARNCHIDDLRRFVRTLNISTAVTPPCYADPLDVEETYCAPWLDTSIATAGLASTTPERAARLADCMIYRSTCPAQACDTNLVQTRSGVPSEFEGHVFVLNRATLKCERVFEFESEAKRPAEWLVCLFMGIACFTVFVLVAVAVGYCLCRQQAPTPNTPEGDQLIDDDDGDDAAKGNLYA